MDIGFLPMVIRTLLLVMLLPLMAGAEFYYPLTSGPSKDLNSWLLGTWEHTGDNGKTYRATVTPKTGDRFWVVFQEPGQTGKSALYEAYISRVGRTSFLTLKCLESKGLTGPDMFLFAQYSVLDQNNVRLRAPALAAASDASPFQLRRQIRRQIKDNTLFPDRGTDWSRVSEVYWTGEPGPQPFQPLRDPPPAHLLVDDVVEEVVEEVEAN
jgi:hypothetical protein